MGNIALAHGQAQHLGDAAALHLMGGHHGKTSGQKDVTHARGGVGRRVCFSALRAFLSLPPSKKNMLTSELGEIGALGALELPDLAGHAKLFRSPFCKQLAKHVLS